MKIRTAQNETRYKTYSNHLKKSYAKQKKTTSPTLFLLEINLDTSEAVFTKILENCKIGLLTDSIIIVIFFFSYHPLLYRICCWAKTETTIRNILFVYFVYQIWGP